MNKDIGKKIAETVCKAWNTLDGSLFEPILSDDFEYISVWVLETMEGKEKYLEYIKGKFESIRKGNNPVVAEILFQEIIGKYVVVLNQGGNYAALEPTSQDDKLKSLWMRPVEMTLPAVFTSKKPDHLEKPKEEKHETEYGNFSKLFLEALMAKDFSLVEDLLADDVVQILYDSNEFVGKNDVVSYWNGWLERWNEPAESTKYEVKYCKYYNREVLSIQPSRSRNLYQMARIVAGERSMSFPRRN